MSTATPTIDLLSVYVFHCTGEDVPDKALVRVHYNGYLEYADEPYDSSRLRGKQQQFVLGNGKPLPILVISRSHGLICFDLSRGGHSRVGGSCEVNASQ